MTIESAPLRVYLVDDHELVLRGLQDLLANESDIEVVGTSATATDASRRIPSTRPNVAVLDARLPDGSGIEVCRDIRSVDPTINVLILTSYDDDEALFAAILAGASGYVLKQIAGNELVEAIRTVSTGRSLLDPTLIQRVIQRASISHDTSVPPELEQLTPQERKILELIAEGLTNRQIAAEMFLAEKTIKNYVSSVLMKLGLERRTQAAVLASRLLRD